MHTSEILIAFKQGPPETMSYKNSTRQSEKMIHNFDETIKCGLYTMKIRDVEAGQAYIYKSPPTIPYTLQFVLHYNH